MKSFNNCNVAVCLSGQSRTFRDCSDSIKSFFSSDAGNRYWFFGHTWDTNWYKVKQGNNIVMLQETVNDIDELQADLRKHFKFEKLVVEKDIASSAPWGNLFASSMRANFLKQKFEVENNMMFDYVIKARYDICFRPGEKYEHCFPYNIHEKTLYSFFGHMDHEFFLPNPDDVIYGGTSLTMDLMDSIYNSLDTGAFYKSVGMNVDNRAYLRVGPGVLMNKWAQMKNMLQRHTPVTYVVMRKTASGLDYKTDWDKIQNINWFKE